MLCFRVRCDKISFYEASDHINRCFAEGSDVGAGEPLLYISGSFLLLVDLETALLQKIGATCVAAYNAKSMVESLPKTSFLAMDARHCAGSEMDEIMAYGASVGSIKAKKKVKAIGFIGSSTDATAHFFGKKYGMGTMPHALINNNNGTFTFKELDWVDRTCGDTDTNPDPTFLGKTIQNLTMFY